MTTDPSPDVVGLTHALGDALGQAVRPASLTTELSKTVAGVRTLFSAAACSCARVQADGATLVFVAADGAGSDSIVGVEMPLGRGIAGWVAMSGQSIVTSDLDKDARFARDIAESTDYIPSTIVAAPMVDEDGEVVGVIEVLDPQSGGAHSGHDLDTLGLIAAQTASIIRLCEVYDALGSILLTGLAQSASAGDFGATLNAMSGNESRQELIALADAFHSLSSAGSSGAALASRILTDVAAYTRTRR